MDRIDTLSRAKGFAAAAATAPHIVHVIERAVDGAVAFPLRAIAELDALGWRQTLVAGVDGVASGADLSRHIPHRVTLIEIADASPLRLAYARRLTRVLTELCELRRPLAVHLHACTLAWVERLVLAQLNGRATCFFTPHLLPLQNPRRAMACACSRAFERMAGLLPIHPVGRGIGAARTLARAWQRPAFAIEEPIEDCYFDATPRPGEPPAIVAVGRAADHNAPEAFAQLALRFEIDELRARFVWIGDGDAAQEARLRAAGVQMRARGTERELARTLADASVFVQTSVWEGLPASLIRAMAVGLPCVVSDVASHRDVIEHGRTGFTVRNLDQLDAHVRLLLDSPELGQRLGRAARAAARQRFGADRFRAQLARLYEMAPRLRAEQRVALP